jgi:hypothetical protein
MPSPAPSRLKLTKRAVDALEPADKDRVVFDAELPGFGIKVTPSGRKVFLVQYRYPPGRTGRIRRYTIGPYSESLTPDQAGASPCRSRASSPPALTRPPNARVF